MKTLGGTLFAYNPISQDYCIESAVASLKALCDEVVIVDAGSSDASTILLQLFADEKTKVICLPNEEWHKHQGREKLAYFTNVAINSLSTEWNINLQADEVIHEDSFDAIREAIEQPNAESFWNRRINMWADSKYYLDVPDNRKPVGDVIIRLAKTKYQSIDDAQSIDAQPANGDYLDKIRIYHMGFIRSKYVHTKKIKHMLEEVFLMGNDKKVEDMGEVFDCWGLGFTKEDLKPITEELPIFVKQWAGERDKINNFIV
jgi:glycosyltransferase involved in cell wall biosynthesis